MGRSRTVFRRRTASPTSRRLKTTNPAAKMAVKAGRTVLKRRTVAPASRAKTGGIRFRMRTAAQAGTHTLAANLTTSYAIPVVRIMTMTKRAAKCAIGMVGTLAALRSRALPWVRSFSQRRVALLLSRS